MPGDPATLVLVGNAGPAMWEVFAKEQRGGPDPLDAWTRTVLGGVAAKLGAVALFPFDGPPYLPFQRWAMKAEAVFPSPIGPLIHPEYGLWHAYRGALAFAEALDLPARAEAESPCEGCAAKPCLTTCPVNALTVGAYDVPACVAHLDSAAGRDCLDLGLRRPPRLPGGARLRLPLAPGLLPHGPLPPRQPDLGVKEITEAQRHREELAFSLLSFPRKRE